MALKTFKRFENKYLLNEAQYQALKEKLPRYMRADSFSEAGSYSIYNIYYDTENNDIIRSSIAKPYYKEKLRLRSYSIPTSRDDSVFLELKKKIGGVVSKRRATMSLWQAESFVRFGISPEAESYLDRQVISEIAQFLSAHEVSAKAFIGYEREAFFGRDDPELRITFDSGIRTRRTAPTLSRGDFGKPLLPGGEHLMEVKILGSLPLWLAGMLSQEQIYSTGFSKYGAEYKRYKAEKQRGAVVISCFPSLSHTNRPACINY